MDLPDELQQRLDDYLDGRLPPADEAKFESEIRQNRALLDEFEFQWKLRQAAQQQAVDDFQAKYLNPKPVASSPARPVLWALAALLLVAVASVFVWKKGGSGAPKPIPTDSTGQQKIDNFQKKDSVEIAQTEKNQSGSLGNAPKIFEKEIALLDAAGQPTDRWIKVEAFRDPTVPTASCLFLKNENTLVFLLPDGENLPDPLQITEREGGQIFLKMPDGSLRPLPKTEHPTPF